MFEQHGMTPEEVEKIQARYGKGPHLAADLVTLTARASNPADLRVLLIQRGNKPYRGWWALPGGFVDPHEDLHAAARRELQEETGIDDLDEAWVEPLHAYGHPNRDPRSRIVSAVFMAWIPENHLPRVQAGDDAAAASFLAFRQGSVEDDRGERMPLAFDHAMVLSDAWRRVQNLARHSSAPLLLLPRLFTEAQLAGLYQTLTGPLDATALIAWLQNQGWVHRLGPDSFQPASRTVQWHQPPWMRGDNST